jgi:hypothetical protein
MVVGLGELGDLSSPLAFGQKRRRIFKKKFAHRPKAKNIAL